MSIKKEKARPIHIPHEHYRLAQVGMEIIFQKKGKVRLMYDQLTGDWILDVYHRRITVSEDGYVGIGGG